MKPCKIIKLTVENVQRIEAVEVEPGGHLVQITGRNAQGKSSLLNAVDWALTGKNSHPPKPIRDGQDTAFSLVDCGEFKVRRDWRTVKTKKDDDGTEETRVLTRVTVENAQGFRATKPQALLESVYDARCIDPTIFVRATDAEQYAMLQEILGIDATETDRLNEADYNERRIINRQAKAAQAAADQVRVPDDAPDEPVDIDALNREYRNAVDHNAERAEALRAREAEGREAQRLSTEADAIREDAERNYQRSMQLAETARQEAIEAADRRSSRAVGIKKRIEAMPGIPDEIPTDEIKTELSAAQDRNRAYDAKRKRDDHLADAKRYRDQSDALTARIDKRKADLKAQIEAADMPVEGLSLADGAVLFNGIPFGQAATSEKYDVSTAIAISTAGPLRTLLIRNGNDLDSDALARVEKRAIDEDFQVMIERIDETGKVGIVIEDGRATDTTKAEQTE